MANSRDVFSHGSLKKANEENSNLKWISTNAPYKLNQVDLKVQS